MVYRIGCDVHKLNDHEFSQVQQVWFLLMMPRTEGDTLEGIGPDFEYYANATNHGSLSRMNMHLLDYFKAHVYVLLYGRRHQGAALGSQTFAEAYVTGKIEDWVKEIKQVIYTSSQPHVVYAIASLVNRKVYLRTVPGR
jgi:hypothetical protein